MSVASNKRALPRLQNRHDLTKEIGRDNVGAGRENRGVTDLARHYAVDWSTPATATSVEGVSEDIY